MLDLKPKLLQFLPITKHVFIDRKMQNIRNLDYPTDKLKVIWIMDGSNDASHEYLGRYDPVPYFMNRKDVERSMR